jgi:hypothetical protein
VKVSRSSPPSLPVGDAWAAAIVATLVRPVTWALGMLGFLAGGGLLVVAVPVLVLPTPTGVQTILGAPLTTLVFGVPAMALVLIALAATAGGLVLVTAATIVGAWAERQGIAATLDGAADEGAIEAVDLDGAPGALRVAVVRLLALAPVIAVAVLSARHVYDVVYRELILPAELATPLPVRIVVALPLHLGGLLLVWLLADSAAAMGVRRLVMERRSVGAAWALGWFEVVRRPLRVLGTGIGGVLVVALLLGPSLAAAAIGWGRVRDILVEGRAPFIALPAVVVWVAIWLGTLVLGSVGAGVRASAWTMIAVRRPAPTSPDPVPDEHPLPDHHPLPDEPQRPGRHQSPD